MREKESGRQTETRGREGGIEWREGGREAGREVGREGGRRRGVYSFIILKAEGVRDSREKRRRLFIFKDTVEESK